jgi:thiamine-phosphate pyrophosphorylase
MPTLANVAARLKAASRKTSAHLPSLWLMTDAIRLPDPLPAVRRLPRGSGVIVRHTDTAARRRIGRAVIAVCRRKGLVCLIAGDWRLAAQLRADGLHLGEVAARIGASAPAHLWRHTSGRILTVAAHGGRAVHQAARSKADAVILAPVFRTASHPDTPALGPLRAAQLVRTTDVPVMALGGVTTAHAARLMGTGIAGVAAIGALT